MRGTEIDLSKFCSKLTKKFKSGCHSRFQMNCFLSSCDLWPLTSILINFHKSSSSSTVSTLSSSLRQMTQNVSNVWSCHLYLFFPAVLVLPLRQTEKHQHLPQPDCFYLFPPNHWLVVTVRSPTLRSLRQRARSKISATSYWPWICHYTVFPLSPVDSASFTWPQAEKQRSLPSSSVFLDVQTLAFCSKHTGTFFIFLFTQSPHNLRVLTDQNHLKAVSHPPSSSYWTPAPC